MNNDIYGIFSDIGVHDDEFYDHFKSNLYKPLALKSVKKENMGDTLYDLMNHKESMLKDVNFSTNYGVLEKYLIKNFDTLLNLPEKLMGNKPFI